MLKKRVHKTLYYALASDSIDKGELFNIYTGKKLIIWVKVLKIECCPTS